MTGGHGHHGHHGHENDKRVAILISVLALFLSIAETAGKSAQTSGMSSNIEASNLWAFFQAKTIRMTTMRTAAEELLVDLPGASPERAALIEAQAKKWRDTAARYDSEPETGEGRKELAARAKAAEAKRDVSFAAYHLYEYASAAFQIAIVLASASLITSVAALLWLAGGLGVLGTLLTALAWFAPTMIHL